MMAAHAGLAASNNGNSTSTRSFRSGGFAGPFTHVFSTLASAQLHHRSARSSPPPPITSESPHSIPTPSSSSRPQKRVVVSETTVHHGQQPSKKQRKTESSTSTLREAAGDVEFEGQPAITSHPSHAPSAVTGSSLTATCARNDPVKSAAPPEAKDKSNEVVAMDVDEDFEVGSDEEGRHEDQSSGQSVPSKAAVGAQQLNATTQRPPVTLTRIPSLPLSNAHACSDPSTLLPSIPATVVPSPVASVRQHGLALSDEVESSSDPKPVSALPAVPPHSTASADCALTSSFQRQPSDEDSTDDELSAPRFTAAEKGKGRAVEVAGESMVIDGSRASPVSAKDYNFGEGGTTAGEGDFGGGFELTPEELEFNERYFADGEEPAADATANARKALSRDDLGAKKSGEGGETSEDEQGGDDEQDGNGSDMGEEACVVVVDDEEGAEVGESDDDDNDEEDSEMRGAESESGESQERAKEARGSTRRSANKSRAKGSPSQQTPSRPSRRLPIRGRWSPVSSATPDSFVVNNVRVEFLPCGTAEEQEEEWGSATTTDAEAKAIFDRLAARSREEQQGHHYAFSDFPSFACHILPRLANVFRRADGSLPACRSPLDDQLVECGNTERFWRFVYLIFLDCTLRFAKRLATRLRSKITSRKLANPATASVALRALDQKVKVAEDDGETRIKGVFPYVGFGAGDYQDKNYYPRPLDHFHPSSSLNSDLMECAASVQEELGETDDSHIYLTFAGSMDGLEVTKSMALRLETAVAVGADATPLASGGAVDSAGNPPPGMLSTYAKRLPPNEPLDELILPSPHSLRCRALDGKGRGEWNTAAELVEYKAAHGSKKKKKVAVDVEGAPRSQNRHPKKEPSVEERAAYEQERLAFPDLGKGAFAALPVPASPVFPQNAIPRAGTSLLSGAAARKTSNAVCNSQSSSTAVVSSQPASSSPSETTDAASHSTPSPSSAGASSAASPSPTTQAASKKKKSAAPKSKAKQPGRALPTSTASNDGPSSSPSAPSSSSLDALPSSDTASPSPSSSTTERQQKKAAPEANAPPADSASLPTRRSARAPKPRREIEMNPGKPKKKASDTDEDEISPDDPSSDREYAGSNTDASSASDGDWESSEEGMTVKKRQSQQKKKEPAKKQSKTATKKHATSGDRNAVGQQRLRYKSFSKSLLSDLKANLPKLRRLYHEHGGDTKAVAEAWGGGMSDQYALSVCHSGEIGLDERWQVFYGSDVDLLKGPIHLTRRELIATVEKYKPATQTIASLSKKLTGTTDAFHNLADSKPGLDRVPTAVPELKLYRYAVNKGWIKPTAVQAAARRLSPSPADQALFIQQGYAIEEALVVYENDLPSFVSRAQPWQVDFKGVRLKRRKGGKVAVRSHYLL